MLFHVLYSHDLKNSDTKFHKRVVSTKSCELFCDKFDIQYAGVAGP